MVALSEALRALHSSLLLEPLNLSSPLSLGPAAVSCSLADGNGLTSPALSLSIGGYPAGVDGGIALRSLSKMVVAAAFIALVERGNSSLSLTSTLASYVPPCAASSLANESARSLLSMTAALDNRLNAAWTAATGIGDHVGFPPICDSLGLGPYECAATVVCPAYPSSPNQEPALPKQLEGWLEGVGRRCEEDVSKCGPWAARGECQANPNYMLSNCGVSCGACVSGERHSKHSLGEKAWWVSAWEGEGEEEGWEGEGELERQEGEARRGRGGGMRRQGGKRGKRVRRARLEPNYRCRYDNYSPSLLDAMVVSATGRPLWRHAMELIAKPLKLQGMLRCTAAGRGREGGQERRGRLEEEGGREERGERGEEGREACGGQSEGEAQGLSREVGIGGGEIGGQGDAEGGGDNGQSPAKGGSSLHHCYSPPLNPSESISPSSWRGWGGGPLSEAWASNGLFGSARDMSLFLSLLANGGEVEGVSILSSSGVAELASDLNDQGLECQGMDTLGLGIGHCRWPDFPNSKCVAREWWGWGSSHGGRAMLLPSRPLRNGRTPALACATMLYLPSEGEGEEGRERLAMRQHEYAHTQALALRTLCPISCSDHHNMCEQWATRGECERNPSYMSESCCKSCRGKGRRREGEDEGEGEREEWACRPGADVAWERVESALAVVRERRSTASGGAEAKSRRV